MMQFLASDVRFVADGGGKVRAADIAIEGADRVARFIVNAMRSRPSQWWRADFTMRFAIVNGLPGVIVDALEGPVQTAAIEIEGRRDSGDVRGTQSGQVAAFAITGD